MRRHRRRLKASEVEAITAWFEPGIPVGSYTVHLILARVFGLGERIEFGTWLGEVYTQLTGNEP